MNPNKGDSKKRKRYRTPSPSFSVPSGLSKLTEENLHHLDSINGDMMPKTTSNPTAEILDALSGNGIPYESDDSEVHKHPLLYAAMSGIFQSERGSPALPSLFEDLKEVRRRHENSNENTFLSMFMLALLSEGRHVKNFNRPITPADEKAWIPEKWIAARLYINFQVKMKLGIIPRLVSKDRNEAGLLESLVQLPRPEPDTMFALFRDAFSPEDTTINKEFREFSEVTSGRVHAWCTVQCKPREGDDKKAIAQACRDGAAMVMSRMYFNHQAVPDQHMYINRPLVRTKDDKFGKPPGPDRDSFCFSVVLNPTMAQIYLHWAEIREHDKTTYHMSLIKAWVMSIGSGILEFRHALFQILDWGLGQRKDEIKAVIAKIREKRAEGIDTRGVERLENEDDDQEQQQQDQGSVAQSASNEDSAVVKNRKILKRLQLLRTRKQSIEIKWIQNDDMIVGWRECSERAET